MSDELAYKKYSVSYCCKDTEIVDSTILKHDPGKKTPIRLYKFVEVIESSKIRQYNP